jgi:DMSO/TMAO reductase YedYZ molybdopterin-dependent catalytic subunit
MKTRVLPVGWMVVVLLTPFCLFGQDGASTLSIQGDIQKPLQWSVESLKTQFAGQAQEIKFTAGMDKSVKAGTGVPLLSVIQSAALRTDKAVKHHDLKFIVVVEAHDGYRVLFSLAELLPQGGHAEAWLLWAVDGKPLSGKEAPLRLVVPTDKAADRAIFGVTQIILADGVKVANQMKTSL